LEFQNKLNDKSFFSPIAHFTSETFLIEPSSRVAFDSKSTGPAEPVALNNGVKQWDLVSAQ